MSELLSLCYNALKVTLDEQSSSIQQLLTIVLIWGEVPVTDEKRRVEKAVNSDNC